MSSESKSTVPLRWVAAAILFFSIGPAIAVLGVLFKVLKYPNWEPLIQLGFVVSVVGGLIGMGMGIVWAVRTLRRSTE